MNQNPFSDFVYQKHQANIINAFDEQMSKKADSEYKPVTVRLDPDVIQTVDNISNFIGVSRQKFLSELIDGGINTALYSIAQAEAWCREDRPRDSGGEEDFEQMEDFIEEIRSKLIKDLVV